MRFHAAMKTIPAIAEPIKPYKGINIAQTIMLINVLERMMLRNTCCFPVIYRNCPTEPANTLNDCPIMVISNAEEPIINSGPNNDRSHFRNINISRNMGIDE